MAISGCRARLGSIYDHAGYLEASAAHVAAELELVEVEDAGLTLLRMPDGSRRTVYGLPRPFGSALAPLSAALVERGPLVAVLSPLEPGPTLARLLCEQGAELVSQRPMAISALGRDDPLPGFDRRAQRAMRTAGARGATVDTGPLTRWFGAFYRAAMIELEADPLYLFSDAYFKLLAAVPHYQVTVKDEHGPAAAALFIHDGQEAYYHLGGRRALVAPVLGAMSLALGEGVREAWRRGCGVAVLGGGRGDARR